MSRRRGMRPQRRPIFLGCEGESERAYGRRLSQLYEEQRQDLAFHIEVLRPGGGDPLVLVERACQKILEIERKRTIRFTVRAVLLDSDRLGQNHDRDTQMRVLSRRKHVQLIWQDPCHEAFLLRHLENCQTLRPPTSPVAMEVLHRYWPDYVKNTPAMQLATRIGLRELAQAASVESRLQEFLDALRFPLS